MNNIIELKELHEKLSAEFSNQINKLKFTKNQKADLLAGFQDGIRFTIFELIDRGLLKMTGGSISVCINEKNTDEEKPAAVTIEETVGNGGRTIILG